MVWAVLTASVLSAGEWRSGFASADGFRTEGKSGLFQEKDGRLFYDTRSAGTEAHRWARLSSGNRYGGDFRVDFRYEILRLDHWNGFWLTVQSEKAKKFEVRIGRCHRKRNDQQIIGGVVVNGRKTERNIPYGACSGELSVERRGRILTLVARDSEGKISELMRVNDFPDGDAFASLKFESAPKTHAAVRLCSYSERWSRDIVDAHTPVWLPVRKLADAVLLAQQAAERKEGRVTVHPGGKAVFALRGALNMRSSRLEFSSAGALRLRVTQPGMDDTIQLGDSLVCDEADADVSFRRRSVPLGGFIAHYPEGRRWKLPQVTSDNIFFLTVSPAGDKPVTISGISLYASVLRPSRPHSGVKVAAIPEKDGEGFSTLGWSSPQAGRKWLEGGGELPLQPGSLKEFAGIPFRISPTVLNPELPVVTIPVGRKSGAFHILQTAGKLPAGSSPLLAACQIIYVDGHTEMLFFVQRWNSGVFRDGFQPRGSADFSWWGPVGFSRARICYLPRPSAGVTWDAVYRTSCMNPLPEKEVRALTFFQFPGEKREFALLGVTLQEVSAARVGLVEPERAVFRPGDKLDVVCMEYSAQPAVESVLPVRLEKSGKQVTTGEVKLAANGRFRAGIASLRLSNAMSAGPVTVSAGPMRSSLLGLMPPVRSGERPFYYTMISGGSEPRGDYERIYRLGYDAAKIHLPWVENEEGKIDFSGWDRKFRRIAGEGLKIEIRNHVRAHAGPPYMQKKAEYVMSYQPGKAPVRAKRIDPADPYAVSRFVNLYRETAKLALDYPVISINANYGLRTELGIRRLDLGRFTLARFREELAKEFSIQEIARRTKQPLGSFDDVTPERIMDDRSGFYMPRLVRLHMRNLTGMQRQVCEAIRDAGYRGHLTFNTSFHTTEQRLLGANTGEYLRLGRDFAPGSLFHETSDRYCLSFAKWMLAKRTLSLPYGDEGNQCPPTYEHCILAYHWMAMMQCRDAIYCQWFGGKPAVQNLAWIKPFHQLLYDAEYLPDPVSLALCLESGTEEAPEIRLKSLHSTTGSHYSLANLLRELNINADRYLVDEFPELDRAVTSSLLIDDVSRFLSPSFGNRIERFIRRGGTFLATQETDSLNGHAFFRRFGIRAGNRDIVEKKIGRGRIVVLPGNWNNGRWDPPGDAKRGEMMKKLLTRLGRFSPLVRSSIPGVFVTPYRAPDGDLLLHVVNITAAPRTARISYSDRLASERVLDHRTECAVSAVRNDGYYALNVEVPALGATVLRASANDQKQ